MLQQIHQQFFKVLLQGIWCILGLFFAETFRPFFAMTNWSLKHFGHLS